MIFLLAYWAPRRAFGELFGSRTSGRRALHCKVASSSLPLAFGDELLLSVLMACSIDQVKTMPKVISERTIMKMETSEALYSEWAYILPFTVMSLVQAVVVHAVHLGATPCEACELRFVSLLWPFLSYPWELFQHPDPSRHVCSLKQTRGGSEDVGRQV